MSKSGRDFRYQRVNFDDDDDSDDLERELGPSSAGSGQSEAKSLRGCVSVTMILATVAAMACVVIYSEVIFPGENGEFLFITAMPGWFFLQKVLGKSEPINA